VYKRKKAELSEISAEQGILQRTEQILRSRDEHIEEFLAELEKKKGVAGFHTAQDNLEKVSERKEVLDEEKGKTLQDISDMVGKLISTIQVGESKRHEKRVLPEFI
jgi:intraflagellar transport protein 81